MYTTGSLRLIFRMEHLSLSVWGPKQPVHPFCIEHAPLILTEQGVDNGDVDSRSGSLDVR